MSIRFIMSAVILSIGLGSGGICIADETEARQDLDTIVARYETLFQQKFRVNVKSPEVNAVLKNQIAQMTQKMFGIPLQLDIDYFTFFYNQGKSMVRVSLANVPEQQKKQMEEQANQMLKTSPLGAFIEALAYDSLKQGVAYLKGNQQQCALKKETPELADFMFNANGQQLMQGLTLSEAWFRLDRKNKTIDGIHFTSGNGGSMLIRMTQESMTIPGSGTVVPVLSKTTIKQSVLQNGPNGVSLPADITVAYGDYVFFPTPTGQ